MPPRRGIGKNPHNPPPARSQSTSVQSLRSRSRYAPRLQRHVPILPPSSQESAPAASGACRWSEGQAGASLPERGIGRARSAPRLLRYNGISSPDVFAGDSRSGARYCRGHRDMQPPGVVTCGALSCLPAGAETQC